MKRIDYKTMVLLAGCLVLLAQHSTGTRAPDFTAISGDGVPIRGSDLKGKVTVLFYMTKDNKELNRDAQNQLNDKYHGMDMATRSKIIRLPIVDCTGAVWPFKGLWEDQLIKNSEIEGCMVYGDWDGNIKKQFAFSNNESITLIIDQKGVIRYSAKGVLNQSDIDDAKDMLDVLLLP